MLEADTIKLRGKKKYKKSGALEEQKKTSGNQLLRRKFHPRDTYLDSSAGKIFRTILKMDKGRKKFSG